MILCYRSHLQYKGETMRSLKDRFKRHRRSVDKTDTKSKPTTVAEHFILTLIGDTLICNQSHLNLFTPHVVQSEKSESLF